MATHTELYSLWNDSVLKNRVIVQVVISAEVVLNELETVPNHTNRLIWAKAAFTSPEREADRMFKAVLAANKDKTVEQIQGASDEAIEVNVDDHIDLFADGGS